MAMTSIDDNQVPLNNPYVFIYFVFFIVVGNFFLLNLFVGVIITTYNREKENIGKHFLLTEKQRKWL